MKRHRSFSIRCRALNAPSWLITAALLISSWTAADNPTGLPTTSMRLLDLKGTVHTIAESPQCRGIALVFLSTECPIARQYVAELNRIHQLVADKRIEFYGVISDASITRKSAARFVDEFQISFPVIFDASGELDGILQPVRVPEAYVFTADRRLVYRGRIDDCYKEVGRRKPEAHTHDFLDALAAVIEGRPVLNPQTEPVGCPVERRSTEKDVTFNRDIAPIVMANCTECHRDNEVAPFALTTYGDCAKRADWLAKVTHNRQMPPWSADVGHGSFLGERMLSTTQIALFQKWHTAGMPEGNGEDLPLMPTFAKGWRLGEPDMIVEAPADTLVPADGADIFQHYVIPLDLPEGETLVGLEFHPGNPRVVHHAVVFYDMLGAARVRDAKSPEPGYRTFGSVGVPVGGVVGLWTPGMTPRFLPDGMGMPLPPKSELLLQLHLHPTGKEEVDRSKIGLYFAKTAISRPISKVPLVVGTLMIDVPPGESRHRVVSSVELPAPVTLLSVLPHMHLIGREMRVAAHLPGGATVPLVWIRNWNFYWQDNYVYRSPISLPAGSKLEIEGFFDNSTSNPSNPSHPPKRVFFGNDSDEEMFFAVFQTVPDSSGAEDAIAGALIRGFQRDWQQPHIKMDARPRIMAEAVEFLGGGEVFLKLMLGKNPAQTVLQKGG